jgi:hypothetical protein
MRDVSSAELDSLGAVAARLGSAGDVVSARSERLSDAALTVVRSGDLAWLGAVADDALVWAARAGELSRAVAEVRIRFIAADAGTGDSGTRDAPAGGSAVTGSRGRSGPSVPRSDRGNRARVSMRARGVPPAQALPDGPFDHEVARRVAVARSQVGYREGRSNATVFGVWSGAPNAPWCASFVSWVFAASGQPLPRVDARNGFVGVANGRRWAQQHGQSSRHPRVGDIFTTVRADGRGHAGIVVAVLAGGRIRTVEGNTTAGGGREGVMVAERTRRVTSGMRFWHVPA